MRKKSMKRWEFSENNSGGVRLVLECCEHWTCAAKTEAEAIEKFNQHFDLDYNYENSISCECCGPRFSYYEVTDEK